MSKKQHISHNEAGIASEPMPVYGSHATYHTSTKHIIKENRIMSKTISVDEYFDKLLSLVHEDYAHL